MNITSKTTKAELIAEIERLTELEQRREIIYWDGAALEGQLLDALHLLDQMKEKLELQSHVIQQQKRAIKLWNHYPNSRKARIAERKFPSELRLRVDK